MGSDGIATKKGQTKSYIMLKRRINKRRMIYMINWGAFNQSYGGDRGEGAWL